MQYTSWRYLLKVRWRNTILKTHRIRRNGSLVFTGRATMFYTLEYPRPCTMSRCTHQGNSIAFHPHSLASPAFRLGGGYRAPRKQSSRRERGGGKEIESIIQSKVWKRRSGGHGWIATDAAISPVSERYRMSRSVFSVYLLSPWNGHRLTEWISKSRLFIAFLFSRLMNESN